MEIVYLEQCCLSCGGTGKRISHRATGEAMKRKREAAGVAAATVAERCGWSAPYVSQLENGVKPWDVERVEKYLTALVNQQMEEA